MTTDTPLGRVSDGTEVIAASRVTGRQLLTTVDAFVDNQRRFDRQARVTLEYGVLAVSRDVYLDYVSSQVMDWSSAETGKLKKIVASIAAKFSSFDLSLPATVFLVKTSGLEEGFAAYTRLENVIVLPANMVASLETGVNFGDPLHPKDDSTYLENVITHEFFHIFSKNNRARRYELYKLVHYRPTGNDVALPDVPWGSWESMRDFKITNPDTPVLNVYIDMAVPPASEGEAADAAPAPLMPVLLANAPYTGGIFFDYLQWWFMAIERDESGQWVAKLTAEGDSVLYTSASLMDQYLGKVGRNFTQEIFHPDEILAQNFVLVVNQPSIGLLAKMNGVLQKGAS